MEQREPALDSHYEKDQSNVKLSMFCHNFEAQLNTQREYTLWLLLLLHSPVFPLHLVGLFFV